MLSLDLEVLYGGAAGGGKSDALLMAALQFVEVPHYAAIIFRINYPALSLPGGLMERAHEWFYGTAARWSDKNKTWTFPSGATLTFGYLDSVNDRYRYLSSEFQFIAFDELTQFKEQDYLYLFSRLRRRIDSKVPLRMRAASNPGGVGHAWVKKRFLTESAPGRRFVPATIQDNPTLDAQEYFISLDQLDAVTLKQLKEGDWTDPTGNHFFPAGWPRYVVMNDAYAVGDRPNRKIYLHSSVSVLIGIDLALSEQKTADYRSFVVGGLLEDGRVLILDVINERIRAEDIAPRLNDLCARWHPIAVGSDNDVISQAMLLEFRRYSYIPEVQLLPINGNNKLVRATGAIVIAQNKRMLLPEPAEPWQADYCYQLTTFTGVKDQYDDMVDATGIVARLVNQLKPALSPWDDLPDVLTAPRGTGYLPAY